MSRWSLTKTLTHWLTLMTFHHRMLRPAVTPTVRMYTSVTAAVHSIYWWLAFSYPLSALRIISEQWQYFASDSEEDDGHWLFSFLANFCHLIDCCVVRLNKTFTHQRCLACWCSGYSIGLLTWRLLAWLPPVPLSGINLRQVVHANVPMSPIRINWYQSKGSDALRLGR